MLAKGILGVVVVVGWFSTFLAGLTINSQPYREALSVGPFRVHNLAMAMLTFTVTNAAILCILSGIIGALSYTVLSQRTQQDTDAEVTQSQGTATDAVLAGVLRSFVIFLVFISGVYIGASDAFGATTPEQYARVVATTCLLSFLVSFDPRYFAKVANSLTH